MSDPTDTPDLEDTVEDELTGEQGEMPDEATLDDDKPADDKPASTGLKADLRKARDQRDEARHQLEQAQSELDGLRQQLEQVHIDRADEVIESLGYRPPALWKLGLTLESIRDDDGNIDRDLIAEQVKALATEFKLGGRYNKPYSQKPVEALTSGAPEVDRRNLWADALKGKRPR